MSTRPMEYEKQGLLHEMFQRQARSTPDSVAIVGESGRQVTFRELDMCTDVLADTLRHKGVVPDASVCIYMEKCIEYTISYIAILKAGGAYLPLDISYPMTLVESIFTDANPKAVLTNEDFAPNLKGVENVIVLGEGWIERLERENSSKHPVPSPSVTLDNLAYIVYSSGTTGKPKGIMCPHRGAVFSYHWRHTTYPYMENDREACNVFFTWEMLRPLLKGIPLYIVPDTVIYDPVLLCQYVHTYQVTRMLFTPSLLEAMLNTSGLKLNDTLKSLRQIFFCGEVVTTSLYKRCLKLLPWIQFINLYSISECHDVADEDLTAYYQTNKDELEKRKFCPVGRPLPGVTILILNSERQAQPVGMSGEIAIGGPTLARGYLKRPDLNQDQFVDCPKSACSQCSSSQLYRTGDWGYSLSDKRLEICGRCDTMVKIRGYSIEVQAVEAALMELPIVNACVVVVNGSEGQDKFLVSYIVPEGQTTKKEIRALLKRKLPFYMIPSYIVFLNSIPILAASGKFDKKSLPAFDKQLETKVDVEGMPTTPMETELAALWAEVLELKNVDVQESFFDLGGHSLLATSLLNKVKESVRAELTVKDLFLYPTVSSMARLIEHRRTKRGELEQIPQIDLVKEVERHDQGKVNIDMQLRAFWRSFRYGDRWKKGRVLLTGATGFLGAFLLKELLLQTRTHIYCLVRKIPGVPVRQRLLNTLQQFGILAKEGEEPTDEQRNLEEQFDKAVTAIKGDVGLASMGMDEDDFTYLCTDIDFVIHAAATVNLIYPYSALQAANVRGTENTILFACTGKIKPIHYISTDAVFPHGLKGCGEEDDVSQLHDQLEDGYAQSKWVAEQLVSKAGHRGIPVVIYRLGNMGGDSRTGHWNPQDFTLLILQTCARLGVAPQVDWQVEMTPVDFAASTIVKLTQNLQLAIGKIFHIINTQPMDSKWLFEWMTSHGYPQSLLPYTEWCFRVRESQYWEGNGILKRLLDSTLKDQSYFSRLSAYDNKVFKQALEQLGLTYPRTDSLLLQRYFEGLATQAVIPKPRSKSSLFYNKPLSGQVAIVTGASSGIGAAISAALAEAGAQVAMAARRTDKLEENKLRIEKEGGAVICVKTDVTNREEVEKLVHHTECTFGPVDILVNNAGVMYYTLMKNLHKEEWDRTIDVNCKGVVNGVGAVLDSMLKRCQGHIVNMSSDAGRKGFPGLAVYSGSKFFVEGFSQGLRQEVCKSGVRVTCIQPGDVNTGLPSLSTDKEALEEYDGSGSCKILESEDIAKAVMFAVTQSGYVAINEILVEPREAPV